MEEFPSLKSHSKSHTLDAGVGYVSYLWHDGSSEQQFVILYGDRTSDSSYSVTVTDDNSCKASDEVKIGFDISDLAVISIMTPSSACYLSDQEPLKVLVKNTGTNTIVNEQIKVVATVDGNIPVTGQKTLTTALKPGDSLEFLFGHTFDFSAKGDHTIRVYSIYGLDADPDNDTLITIITHVGTPPIDLGGVNDSLGATLPHTLDAGADYVSYLWNGTPGARTFNATQYGWYILEVTDLQGCEGIDSVYLKVYTGIEEYQLPGVLKVYPVPTDDMLNIVYRSTESEHLFLHIYDAKGRIILIKEYHHAKEIIESIDVSDLNKGLYFLKLRSEKQQLIRQIIIQ